MPVSFFTENVTLPKQFKKNLLKQWIKDIILSFGRQTGSITYIFCNDQYILTMNRQYLHHDYYTDIITFDYSEDDILTGELFISLKTVKSNSIKFKTEYLFELYRVMIHGVLHLCGLDDQTEEEQQRMTLEENKALEILHERLEF